MIRFIAAIDEKRGIANDKGIPWLGKLPTDVKQYREHIHGSPIIMGLGHYLELNKPYPDSDNYVAAPADFELAPGFSLVTDAHAFLQEFEGDIWNIGGAMLYESTLDLADELYLTRLQCDFGCTKFFPAFKDDFTPVDVTPQQVENGITFSFERWVRT